MKSNIEIVRSYLNNERPFTKVGYTGDINKYIIRKEGETWADSSGKEWIHKNGVTQTVTRVMDIVREASNQKCLSCKREIRWGSRQDEKIHAKTGKCLDCLTEEETLMRARGKFKVYEKKKLLSNELTYLQDVKKYLAESNQYLIEHKIFTYVNANGLVEEWHNESRNEVLENVKKDFVKCLKEIRRVESELNKVDAELNKTSDVPECV